MRDTDSQIGFHEHQLLALAHQAKRVLLPVLVVACVLTWLSLRPFQSESPWWLWGALALLLVARWRYSSRFQAANTLTAKAVCERRVMACFNVGLGTLTGAYCWLSFPENDAMQQAVITTLLVGLAAGAVASCAANRWCFIGYTVPLLGQLCAAWICYGEADPEGLNYLIASALTALFWVLLGASNDTESWIRSSFSANQANAELVGRLKTLNLELQSQREAALAANQAKTRFLAAASHDLRQPLHALSLYSASLSLQGLGGRAKQLADSIQHGISYSLAPLLDALLDVSKLDANAVIPVKETFDLSAQIKRITPELEATSEEKGLNFVCAIKHEAWVATDPRLLIQVIRNLLDNAIKYTHAGGVTLSLRHAGDTLEVCIQDTGIGIEPSEVTQVFEEFYQCGNAERDRSKGLGLGLAIVKRLCNLLGVQILLSSELGLGTTVRLLVPLVEAPLIGPSAQTEPKVHVGPLNKQILVIDDESSVRESTVGLLTDWGCEVSYASSKDEAKRIASAQRFDIFLSDLRLRASETGLDVLRSLAQLQPGAACWLVTGETGPIPWQQLRQENIRVFHKPLEPGQFFRALSGA